MIKDRDELVEAILDNYVIKSVDGIEIPKETYELTRALSKKGLIGFLDAMQDAGVDPQPREATKEMLHAALYTTWQGKETYTHHQITAALAAGPYRRKE